MAQELVVIGCTLDVKPCLGVGDLFIPLGVVYERQGIDHRQSIVAHRQQSQLLYEGACEVYSLSFIGR